MTTKFNRRQPPLGRRDFLIEAGKTAVVIGGIGGLGYLAYGPDPVRKAEEKIHTFPGFLPEASAVRPALAIAHGNDADRMVRATVEKLGGMGRFVKKGDKVLVKPNVGWDRQPEQAANTGPEVVGAVVRLCREAGAAKVWVTDVSISDPVRSFARSGIAEAARLAGGEVLYPADGDFVQADFKGELIKVWPACRFFLEADRLINVPIVKHHTLSRCTLGLKNLYGVLGGKRNQLHQQVHVSIADLAAAVRPTLTVMDATRVLRSNGPTGGSLDDVVAGHTVAAATDPVALDSYALTFLDLVPDDVAHLGLAQARGLGTLDWKSLHPPEERLG